MKKEPDCLIKKVLNTLWWSNLCACVPWRLYWIRRIEAGDSALWTVTVGIPWSNPRTFQGTNGPFQDALTLAGGLAKNICILQAVNAWGSQLRLKHFTVWLNCTVDCPLQYLTQWLIWVLNFILKKYFLVPLLSDSG